MSAIDKKVGEMSCSQLQLIKLKLKLAEQLNLKAVMNSSLIFLQNGSCMAFQ